MEGAGVKATAREMPVAARGGMHQEDLDMFATDWMYHLEVVAAAWWLTLWVGMRVAWSGPAGPGPSRLCSPSSSQKRAGHERRVGRGEAGGR